MPSPRHDFAGKRYFTVAQANRMLPLLRSIVRDIVESAAELQSRQETLRSLGDPECLPEEKAQQWWDLRRELERGAARIEEFLDELRELGVEFKGWDGLVDFPAIMGDREVYLCWKLGEPEVAHWHEVDAGFAGRRKLTGEEPIRVPSPLSANG